VKKGRSQRPFLFALGKKTGRRIDRKNRPAKEEVVGRTHNKVKSLQRGVI
jgi:hypothetical protein